VLLTLPRHPSTTLRTNCPCLERQDLLAYEKRGDIEISPRLWFLLDHVLHMRKIFINKRAFSKMRESLLYSLSLPICTKTILACGKQAAPCLDKQGFCL